MTIIDLRIEIDTEADEEASVFVDGTVGEQAYKFLFDTGATRSAIMLDDFSAQFTSVAKDTGSGVFSASRDELITVPALQIGPLVHENLTIGRMHTDGALRYNIVGMDFWQHHRCEFYFDQAVVRVDQPASNLSNIVLHDLQTDKVCHPYLDLVFESTSAKAVWDTGASITVVDSNFVEKNPQYFTPDGTDIGTDSTGASFETLMYKMAGFTIGGQAFPDVRVACVDFSHMNAHIDIPMDVGIGYNILSQANWLFDFPQKKWALIE